MYADWTCFQRAIRVSAEFETASKSSGYYCRIDRNACGYLEHVLAWAAKSRKLLGASGRGVGCVYDDDVALYHALRISGTAAGFSWSFGVLSCVRDHHSSPLGIGASSFLIPVTGPNRVIVLSRKWMKMMI